MNSNLRLRDSRNSREQGVDPVLQMSKNKNRRVIKK